MTRHKIIAINDHNHFQELISFLNKPADLPSTLLGIIWPSIWASKPNPLPAEGNALKTKLKEYPHYQHMIDIKLKNPHAKIQQIFEKMPLDSEYMIYNLPTIVRELNLSDVYPRGCALFESQRNAATRLIQENPTVYVGNNIIETLHKMDLFEHSKSGSTLSEAIEAALNIAMAADPMAFIHQMTTSIHQLSISSQQTASIAHIIKKALLIAARKEPDQMLENAREILRILGLTPQQIKPEEILSAALEQAIGNNPMAYEGKLNVVTERLGLTCNEYFQDLITAHLAEDLTKIQTVQPLRPTMVSAVRIDNQDLSLSHDMLSRGSVKFSGNLRDIVRDGQVVYFMTAAPIQFFKSHMHHENLDFQYDNHVFTDLSEWRVVKLAQRLEVMCFVDIQGIQNGQHPETKEVMKDFYHMKMIQEGNGWVLELTPDTHILENSF